MIMGPIPQLLIETIVFLTAFLIEFTPDLLTTPTSPIIRQD